MQEEEKSNLYFKILLATACQTNLNIGHPNLQFSKTEILHCVNIYTLYTKYYILILCYKYNAVSAIQSQNKKDWNDKPQLNTLATQINIFWHYENSLFQHEDLSQLSVFISHFGNFQYNWTAFIWNQSLLSKKLLVLFPVYNTSNSNTHEILHISLPDPFLEIRNDRWDLWEKRILSVHTAQGQVKKSTSSAWIFTSYCLCFLCSLSHLIKPESSSIALHACIFQKERISLIKPLGSPGVWWKCSLH